MDNSPEKSGSSREATRKLIVMTFNRLMLEGDNSRPRVAEIVAEAGVARSTFYDHFDGVEALFDESLSIILSMVARCLVGDGVREEMVWVMAHVHENRARGRDMLTGPAAQRTENLLARILLQQLEGQPEARLHAILIAGTVMAALGAWMTGQLSTTPEAMAGRLIATAHAIRGANTDDPA